MSYRTDHLVVITGGPGAGKSTLVTALAEAGFRTVPESGRAIIREQAFIGGPGRPDVDPALYAELMLSRDLAAWQAQADAAGTPADPIFFDRGVVDVLGYLMLLGLEPPAHLLRACERCRYAPRVFIAPPWPEIFVRDAERRQDLDEAVRTHAAMVEAYRRCGYELVELPRGSVAERVAFVLDARAQ